MPEPQFALIDLQLLLEKAKRRKNQPLRLLPHDQMDDDGEADQSEAAEQDGMDE